MDTSLRLREMRTKLIAVLAMAVAAALTLNSCGDSSKPSSTGPAEASGPYRLALVTDPKFEAGTTMEKLSKAKKITIGTKFDQPLFGLKGPDGRPRGFDVAIGSLVASRLGIPYENIEWVETVSINREPFLQQGRVDIVVATYTINDERKKVVDFAGPYYEAGQSIMVLKSNTDVKAPEDLRGKPVCSVEGSTPAARIVKDYGANLVATDAYSKCLEPLRNGQVVAMTTDNVILAGFVDQNPEFKLVGQPFTKEPYGIGLKKNDDKFRAFINDVLDEAEKDGTWKRLWQETAGKVLPTPNPPALARY
jgi:glutamate transport system substrate-binding protein